MQTCAADGSRWHPRSGIGTSGPPGMRPTRGAGVGRVPVPRHDEVRGKETPLMRRCRLWPAGAAVPALALALVGCGATGSGTSAPSPAARPCGAGRTAANVRVLIEVSRGTVTCATALHVEQAYATALAAGKAPGNGGGGPVSVSGWICIGFDTPQVLRTGQTSKCTQDSSEILAVLPSPS